MNMVFTLLESCVVEGEYKKGESQYFCYMYSVGTAFLQITKKCFLAIINKGNIHIGWDVFQGNFLGDSGELFSVDDKSLD